MDFGLKLEFPAPRLDPFSPPDMHAHMRAECPIARARLWDGSWAWLISRHADARAVLSDPRFSSDVSTPGFPNFHMAAKMLTAEELSFVRMDDPDHKRLRSMLIPHFTARALEPKRSGMRDIIHRCLRDMSLREPPADVVTALASPIASTVICDLLGIEDDREFFLKRSEILVATESLEDVANAFFELIGFLDDLVAIKIREHPHDILGQVAAAYEGSDLLAGAELAGLARLLFIAGTETTVSMIALSVLSLLTEPDIADRLKRDTRIVPALTEELLRYHNVLGGGVARAATADVRIGGQLIRAGEGVLILIDSASQDEAVFEDAGRVRLTAEVDRRHLAFGYGIHQCLGQTLARMVIQEFLAALFGAFPDLRLAQDLDQITPHTNLVVHGIKELLVAW